MIDSVFYPDMALSHALTCLSSEDPSWMNVFDDFLHEVCDQFDNMVISGDFNLPNVLWGSIDSASDVNELAFIETFHDHLLTQLNKKRTVNVTDTECFQKIRRHYFSF